MIPDMEGKSIDGLESFDEELGVAPLDLTRALWAELIGESR
jgi:hypothetical protein